MSLLKEGGKNIEQIGGSLSDSFQIDISNDIIQFALNLLSENGKVKQDNDTWQLL